MDRIESYREGDRVLVTPLYEGGGSEWYALVVEDTQVSRHGMVRVMPERSGLPREVMASCVSLVRRADVRTAAWADVA